MLALPWNFAEGSKGEASPTDRRSQAAGVYHASIVQLAKPSSAHCGITIEPCRIRIDRVEFLS